MGIYDREYYRGEGAPPAWTSRADWVCRSIIAANVVVFILQVLSQRWVVGVQDVLELDLESVISRFQVWRLLTGTFCHAFPAGESFPWHLIFNMLFLWWFGRELETIYGSREFLAFYLAAALISSISFLALGLAIGDPTPMIGASGAVMAVTMVYARIYPFRKILLFFLIPIEIRWLAIGYVIFEAYPVLQALGTGQMSGNVAHAAHLGGLVFGFLYKHYEWRVSGLFSRTPHFWRPRLFSSKPKLRVVTEEEALSPDLDRRVDQVLTKISRSGEASLTDEEREILIRASQRYRRRQP